MLCLTRKLNESIILQQPNGESIRVKLLELSRGRVTIGIQAEQNVKIFREELLDADNLET